MNILSENELRIKLYLYVSPSHWVNVTVCINRQVVLTIITEGFGNQRVKNVDNSGLSVSANAYI